MRISVTETYSDYGKWVSEFSLSVDGEELLSVCNMNECPEDALLHRDLIFVYDIPDLMRKAYEAGKNGEEFEYNKKRVTEED